MIAFKMIFFTKTLQYLKKLQRPQWSVVLWIDSLKWTVWFRCRNQQQHPSIMHGKHRSHCHQKMRNPMLAVVVQVYGAQAVIMIQGRRSVRRQYTRLSLPLTVSLQLVRFFWVDHSTHIYAHAFCHAIRIHESTLPLDATPHTQQTTLPLDTHTTHAHTTHTHTHTHTLYETVGAQFCCYERKGGL